MKKLLHASALITCAMAALPVHAEISASVDVSNLYLFRGLDLSNGSPALAGTLEYEHQSGAYAGIWSSSGDDTLGTEVNFYLGYQGAINDFSYNLSYLNYYYPQTKGTASSIVDFNDYAEVSLGLGYQDVSVSLTAPTSDDIAGDYLYYLLSYSYQDLSLSLGVNDHEDSSSSYSHVDLGYQFNERLRFAVSQVIDQGSGGSTADATLFLVNLSLPIEL